jgi:hypothetical protein
LTASPPLDIAAGMRALAVVLLGLLTTAPVATAETEPSFFVTCRDGQKPIVGTMPCDVDDHADGVCTFGERGGKNFRVPVGKTRTVANSCEAVGSFACDPPAPVAPHILYPPSSPKSAPVAEPKAKDSAATKKKRLGLGECHRDSDCVPTAKGGCLSRNTMWRLHDPYNTKVSCKCLTGPVWFGCVPRGSSWDIK